MLAEQPGSMVKSEQRKRLGSGMCRGSVASVVVTEGEVEGEVEVEVEGEVEGEVEVEGEGEGEVEGEAPHINSETTHDREGMMARETLCLP